jgi:hypothetical protein
MESLAPDSPGKPAEESLVEQMERVFDDDGCRVKIR